MTQSAPQTGISLKVTKTIKAPRERVFAAWTQPEHLHKWWGAHESFSAPIAEVDLRVGGKYRFGMLEPGKDAPYVSYGVYQEVVEPEKLVFTWAFEKMPVTTRTSCLLKRWSPWSSSTRATPPRWCSPTNGSPTST